MVPDRIIKRFFSQVLMLPLAILHSCLVFSQNLPAGTDADCAGIGCSPNTIDIGTVKLNSVTVRKVTIKNTGMCPLVIFGIKGAGPREYLFDKTYLQQGDSCHLNLFFTATETGPINRPLYLLSNAGAANASLSMKGEVVPENRCATMLTGHDTLNFGTIPYLLGKRYFIPVRNTGTCGLTFTVVPIRDQFLNLLDYTHDTISPGDTGKISIHLGGQQVGNYYGSLCLLSNNARTAVKTLYLKARFAPPPSIDTGAASILLSQDMFNFNTIPYTGNASLHSMAGDLEVTNAGKKVLAISQNDPYLMVGSIPNIPIRILPGATAKMTIRFYYTGAYPANGEVLVHTLISGNFPGRNIPVYARWKYEKTKDKNEK